MATATQDKLDLFKEHKAEYATPKKPVILKTTKAHYLAVTGRVDKPKLPKMKAAGRAGERALRGRRTVDFDEQGVHETPIYERERLDPGSEIGELMGVRRIPETFIYDPAGHLRHQSRGPVDWSSGSIRGAIEQFKTDTAEDGHEH